eukprot:3617244-Rhodomonas_salina.1
MRCQAALKSILNAALLVTRIPSRTCGLCTALIQSGCTHTGPEQRPWVSGLPARFALETELGRCDRGAERPVARAEVQFRRRNLKLCLDEEVGQHRPVPSGVCVCVRHRVCGYVRSAAQFFLASMNAVEVVVEV